MTSEEPLDASPEKPTLDRPIATPTKIMDSKYTLQERLLKRNQSKKSSLALSNGVLFVVGLMAIWVAHYAILDYPHLEYCSNVRYTQFQHQHQTQQVHKPFYSFMPSCIPCPQDSLCSSRTVLGCRDSTSGDFHLKKNLLSSLLPNSLLFFPINQPYCVYDSTSRIVKETRNKRQIDQMIRVTEKLVREFTGEVR
jgi:hypothetical protein